MLQIKDLHKSYAIGDSSLHVLKGVNLDVNTGEMVAIMGSSGSGKSTLLNIIGMLDEADSGSYVLDGLAIENLTEKKAAVYRNKFLGFIFQSFNLINYKNAIENVALPLYYQGVKRKERLELAKFHLKKVGLEKWSEHLPKERKTILMVTHEEDIASMCKRIIRLRDGVIIEDKEVKQVRASQYV